MNNKKLKEILAKLKEENTKENWENALNWTNERIKKADSKSEKNDLQKLRLECEIGLKKIEIEALDENKNKELYHLMGQLIRIYKKLLSKSKGTENEYQIRHEILEGLKKQKETIKAIKNDKENKISFPEKVALKVKDIAKTAEIFMREHDVLTKIKNTVVGTAKGIAGIAAVTGIMAIAYTVVLGGPLTLAAIATLNTELAFAGLSTILPSVVSSLAPAAAYTGLTNVIQNFSSKTSYEMYEYQQTDEYKAQVQAFLESHKVELEKIAKLKEEAEKIKNPEQQIEKNQEIINELESISKQAKISGMQQAFDLQILSYYQKNKACCEQIKNDYLNEKNNDKEKYKNANKKLMKINFEIWKRGNSIKEAFKSSSKGFFKGAKVVLLAKAIMTAISPGSALSITGMQSILEPLAYLAINGVIGIPTYQDKLKYKQTEYEGQIETENKERIEEIINDKKNQYQGKLSYA